MTSFRSQSIKLTMAVLTAAASLVVPSVSSAPGRPDKEAPLSRQARSAAEAPARAGKDGGSITLTVNLIWEGRDLKPHNIEALKRFRSEFGSVSVVHFVSPAYFTKPGVDAVATKKLLSDVIQPGDHVGMYLAGWKSLAASAGVAFRNGPTFWGATLGSRECASDCGLEVPIHIYTDDELSRLVINGRDQLAAQGFAPPITMAAAGWVASPGVLDAASRAGFRHDFSAVSPELLVGRLANFPLYDWVKGLWPQTTPHTQPYVQPTRHGGMTEFPQSLAAMDYLTAKDVGAIFAEYTNNLRHAGDGSLVFPLTMYQESAAQSLPLLKKALQDIFAVSQETGVALNWLQLPAPSVAKLLPVAH